MRSESSRHNETHVFSPGALAKQEQEVLRSLRYDELPRNWGDYEDLEPKDSGAMGMVYRGRHKGLQRWEAVKVLKAGREADSRELERFKFEAEAAAALDHPNIVPVYRVGVVEEMPFFAMKWLDGGTLAKQMARYRDQPIATAVLMAKIARAVHYAHQRGILHRDLKPSNIMLDEQGEPHITDFGLARREGVEHGLTQTGSVVGTPRYMAPEQARSAKHITTAADIYSLGAILYEIITGLPPLNADSLFELLHKIDKEVPKIPSSLNHKVHRDLQDIAMKCLEKEAAHRYPSALELAEDLERVSRGEAILIRPPGLKEWIIRELTKVPPPFEGYVTEVKYWFAGLMLTGQLAIFGLCQTNGPVLGVWLVYLLAWVGSTLALWLTMAHRFTRLPLTEQHSVMVAIGHLLAHVAFNLFCLPFRGAADQVLPLYPAYCILSGLALFTIGTTHWGRFYWYGLLVMALTPFTQWFPAFAPLIYGLPVSATMISWAIMLQRLIRRSRGQRAS